MEARSSLGWKRLSPDWHMPQPLERNRIVAHPFRKRYLCVLYTPRPVFVPPRGDAWVGPPSEREAREYLWSRLWQGSNRQLPSSSPFDHNRSG